MEPRTFRFRVPGGELFAQKWIPAEQRFETPLLLLHDSLGCVGLWRDFPAKLAERLSRLVFAYDRLGFGRSSAREALPGLGFIEEEAQIYFPHVQHALGLQTYILFGHSVGGGMAVAIAAGRSDCAAVITESAQAFVEELTVVGIRNARKEFQNHGQMARMQKWHGDKADWVFRAWTDTWLSPAFADWSIEPCIGRVRCPLLAIHGDHDEYGSRAFPEFISGRTGGPSEMAIMQNCGHIPHREMPHPVMECVAAFLARHAVA